MILQAIGQPPRAATLAFKMQPEASMISKLIYRNLIALFLALVGASAVAQTADWSACTAAICAGTNGYVSDLYGDIDKVSEIGKSSPHIQDFLSEPMVHVLPVF